MNDFSLFERAIHEYETKQSESVVTCLHDDCITENGVVICMNCGSELNRIINHEKDWRYYGHSDTKHTSDPNRVQVRRIEEKNIFKDVENMGFSDKIISMANQIYSTV